MERDPDHRAPAVVTFNNQNSILMAMYLRFPAELLCLLHDNRIFAFQKSNGESSSVEEQNLILALLTTAKFRLMGFLYSGYHLVDNTLFVLIIVLSILNNNFTLPDHHEIALFAAIGLEGFYDVMLFTHRYWILQRLSIFIGIVLYIMYFLVVTVMALTVTGLDPDRPTHISINLVWAVLGSRFGAFILEELVDIAVDLQLHNDLVKLNQERIQRKKDRENEEPSASAPKSQKKVDDGQSATDEPPEQEPDGDRIAVGTAAGAANDMEVLVARRQRQSWYFRLRKYLSVTNAVKMPDNVEYIGSLFAWGQRSVFDKDVWLTTRVSPSWSICLCFFPAIPAFFVLIPLLGLCFSAAFIIFLMLLVGSIVTCRCADFWNRNYWRELRHL